jgi:hypothetical protein
MSNDEMHEQTNELHDTDFLHGVKLDNFNVFYSLITNI